MLNRKNKRGCLVSGCVVFCVILLIILIAVVIGWMTCSNDSTKELTLGEAVDNTDLSWTTGGNAEWFPQTSISFYDGDAAQSGAVTNYQSTWLRTSVTGPGTLTFYWKLSSGDGLDFLEFSIDGVQQKQITGTVDWQPVSYKIDSGEHDLEWKYTESGSVAGSSWLDKVELAPPGRGTLLVYTNYKDVNIYVDNELIGTSKYYEVTKYIDWGYKLSSDNQTEGTHTLKLSKVGYNEWIKQVSITTGKTTTVYAFLEEGSGEATTRDETIPADPDAFGRLYVKPVYPQVVRVYIDGEFSGSSGKYPDYVYWDNMYTSPPVLEGTYTLKLTITGYGDWTKQVSIDGGRTTSIYAYLEPGVVTTATRNETITADSKFGSLAVNTGTLEGVNVYIDGEFGGATLTKMVIPTPPYYKYHTSVNGLIEDNGLIEGWYTVKLTKSGYEEWTEYIEIKYGLTTTISATLSKL